MTNGLMGPSGTGLWGLKDAESQREVLNQKCFNLKIGSHQKSN